MDSITKKERFVDLANRIKNLGYKVFVTNREFSTYGWIVNEKDEIGYFQMDGFGCGITFSTIHKPMNEYGSGFACDDAWVSHIDFSRELVDRCFAKYPDWMNEKAWFERKYLYNIKKWSAKEYLENYWDKGNLVEI